MCICNPVFKVDWGLIKKIKNIKSAQKHGLRNRTAWTRCGSAGWCYVTTRLFLRTLTSVARLMLQTTPRHRKCFSSAADWPSLVQDQDQGPKAATVRPRRLHTPLRTLCSISGMFAEFNSLLHVSALSKWATSWTSHHTHLTFHVSGKPLGWKVNMCSATCGSPTSLTLPKMTSTSLSSLVGDDDVICITHGHFSGQKLEAPHSLHVLTHLFVFICCSFSLKHVVTLLRKALL